MSDPATHRPFVFSVVEDDGENVTIEISEEDYQLDLATGIDEDATLKPGRYKMKRGGFLARHPEVKIKDARAPNTVAAVEGDSDKQTPNGAAHS